uniref:IBB domain-containing protein n=1 Tax=Schizaphis graminum TaxID=13262 RepID=A0A2S2P563_SCHGA
MNSASTARVKEKIRYDVDIHRQLNKQMLMNSRRGVKIEEDFPNNELTVEDMQNMALEIKRGKQITVKQLKLLQNGFLDYLDFIVLFYNVPGAVDSLLHLASSKNEEIQLAAIECFLNMGLGDREVCFKLLKLVAPYLMMYINHLNFNISAMSIWTLGNLSDSNPDACKLLQDQNFFGALVDRLQNSTCDRIIFDTFYTLRLFLKTYLDYLPIDDLNKLLHVCYKRLSTWKDSFWIVYQISCCQDSALKDSKCIDHLLDALHEDIIDITCLVPILRTISNIIAKDSTNLSAITFLIGLKTEEGSIIRNILINNRNINLNDECAWLLGNAFKAVGLNEQNLTDRTFNKVCNYLLI